MPGVEIITFGCRLNAFESEVMRRAAGDAGLGDAVIVNTCAVTAEAERQARQAIRRARREHPDGAHHRHRLRRDDRAGALRRDRRGRSRPRQRGEAAGRRAIGATAARRSGPRSPHCAEYGRPPRHLVDGFEGTAPRAFLQVQQGCDHRCTFCIIPYGRGPSRSVPIGAIVEQARRLVDGGCREIVLTGVDLTAYGADLPGRPSLGQMVRRLLAAVPELPRLRLSSLDPVEIDDDLWRLIGDEPRLMPHLHLSLQAGDDLILKRMKRRHSRAEAIAAAAARPRVAPGHRARRRPDRRLPDRERGDVPPQPRPRRGMRPRLPPRLSLQRRGRARRRRACRSSTRRWSRERAARLRAAGAGGARRRARSRGSAARPRCWSSARASAAPRATPRSTLPAPADRVDAADAVRRQQRRAASSECRSMRFWRRGVPDPTDPPRTPDRAETVRRSETRRERGAGPRRCDARAESDGAAGLARPAARRAVAQLGAAHRGHQHDLHAPPARRRGARRARRAADRQRHRGRRRRRGGRGAAPDPLQPGGHARGGPRGARRRGRSGWSSRSRSRCASTRRRSRS